MPHAPDIAAFATEIQAEPRQASVPLRVALVIEVHPAAGCGYGTHRGADQPGADPPPQRLLALLAVRDINVQDVRPFTGSSNLMGHDTGPCLTGK